MNRAPDPELGAEEFTALHAAIMRRDDATVDLLLENGADPNLPLGAWTPVRTQSSDVYFHRAWVGATPAWLAARFGTPYVFRRLIEHGADPKVVHRGAYYGGGIGGALSDRQEVVTTTLMAAIGMSTAGSAWVAPDPEQREEEILEKVRMMVELGVDVKAVNQEGRTALEGARINGYRSVVQLLLDLETK